MVASAPRGGLVVSLFAAACGPFVSAGSPSHEAASRPTRDRAVFVDFVAERFRNDYALASFKTERRQWDLEEELASLRRRIAVDDEDAFRRSLYRFFRSPEDLHTSVSLAGRPDTLWLGLHLIRTADEGVRVAWVDEALARSGLQPGVRVYGWDGRAVEEVIRATSAQTEWRSTPAFERVFADWLTTFRGGYEWDELPSDGDPVVLDVEMADGARIPVTLAWRRVDPTSPSPITRCPYWSASATSYVPPLGPTTWSVMEDTEIPAYVFSHQNERYGYLRLHTYAWPESRHRAVRRDFDRAVDAFIARDVAAIVIDQTGNGGGNFVHALTLLSRLSNEDRVAPTQRFRYASDGGLVGFPDRDVFRRLARDLAPGATIPGATRAFAAHPLLRGPLGFLAPTPENATELRAFAHFVADPPAPPHGRSALNSVPLSPPHHQVVARYRYDATRGPRFRGPLLLLIDARNISAAEYTAAALADGTGARLFGVRTAGAGGDQRTYRADGDCGADPLTPCVPSDVAGAMRRLGVRSFSLTVTEGWRQRGNRLGPRIENRGIAPDIPYRLTAEDTRTGGVPMRAAILAALAETAE